MSGHEETAYVLETYLVTQILADMPKYLSSPRVDKKLKAVGLDVKFYQNKDKAELRYTSSRGSGLTGSDAMTTMGLVVFDYFETGVKQSLRLRSKAQQDKRSIEFLSLAKQNEYVLVFYKFFGDLDLGLFLNIKVRGNDKKGSIIIKQDGFKIQRNQTPKKDPAKLVTLEPQKADDTTSAPPIPPKGN